MYEATSDLDGNDRQPRLSRRQLVKAGAWATPLVVMATAAPASAAVSPPPPTPALTISALTATANWAVVNNNERLANVTGTAQVNVGATTPSVDVGPVTLRLAITKHGLRDAMPTIVAPEGGWAATSVTTVGNSAIFTFTWNGTMTSGSGLPLLTYSLPGDATNRSSAVQMSILGTVTATGATGDVEKPFTVANTP